MSELYLTPELDVLKSKMRTTWMAGDFGKIAKAYLKGSGEFVERLNLQPGIRVLDVACGTGNTAIPAAHAGAAVTGVDIAENLIEQARINAEKTGLKIQFEVGDAENLPYRDSDFDVVMTMFGAMFAPRPEVTATELKRVCCPKGTIAMGNWTPTSFVGQMFKINAKHVPPPDVPSPILWGDEETVKTRFKEGIADLRTTRRKIMFRFPLSPIEVVEYFRQYFGPIQMAFKNLDDAGQAALRSDLEELWSAHNRATDGTTEVESEYLEVIAVRA